MKLFPQEEYFFTTIGLVQIIRPTRLTTLLHYVLYQTGTFWSRRHTLFPNGSFAVFLRVLHKNISLKDAAKR